MITTTSKNVPSHPDLAKILRLTLVAALIAVICQIGWCFMNYAIEAPPSFDGGMNLNVAVSFIQGKGYGFFYNVFYPFPAQTDGPFILPAALVLWLGGITNFTTQFVSLLYLAVFAAAVYALLRRLQLAPWVALIGIILCLRTPGMHQLAINGFGEIPCLTFFLLGLMILSSGFREAGHQSWKPLSGGIALGLCAITKTMGLIMVVPTVFVFVLLLFARERRLSGAIGFFSGIALPVAGWELFRFVDVGGSHNYLTWWRLQLNEILFHSGVSENVAGHIHVMTKAKIHLEILASEIAFPVVLVIALLAIVFIVMGILAVRLWQSRNLARLFMVLSLSLVTGAFFIWWIFVTPTLVAILRRILAGLILLQLLSVVSVATLAGTIADPSAVRSGFRRTIVIPAVCLVLIAQVIMAWQGGILSFDPKPSSMDAEEMTAAEILRKLPNDSVFFGSGWWRAPVLALFSGHRMMNIDRWSPEKINALPRKYLVQDRFARTVGREEFQQILNASTYRVVYEAPYAAIYELLSVKAYQPFQPSELSAPNLASGFDALNSDYPYVRGLYPLEGRHRWCRPEAGFLLRRTGQDRLLLTLTIPDLFFKSLASPADLRLSIYSQGCIDGQYHVARGRQTLSIPLTCKATTEPAVMEIAVRLNAQVPVIWRIESDNIPRRGFMLESLQLVDSRASTVSGRTDGIHREVSLLSSAFSDEKADTGIAETPADTFFAPEPECL